MDRPSRDADPMPPPGRAAAVSVGLRASLRRDARDDGFERVAGARVVVVSARVGHVQSRHPLPRAAGVRVVATPACGIEAASMMRIVPAGDTAGLRGAIRAAIDAGA